MSLTLFYMCASIALLQERLLSIGPVVKIQYNVKLPISLFMGRTIKLNCVMVLTQINSASHCGCLKMFLSLFPAFLWLFTVQIATPKGSSKRHLQRRLEIKSFEGNGYSSQWPVGGRRRYLHFLTRPAGGIYHTLNAKFIRIKIFTAVN